MWFEAISGLRINPSKSEIIPVGTVDKVELVPSPLLIWVSPLGLLTSRWGFGTPLKIDFKKGWPLGRDNTYPRVGDSR